MADTTHTLFDFAPLATVYDQWYETPGGQAHDRQQKAAVARLLPRPHPSARLLDVGCGTGHWSRFFAEHGYEVFGLDITPAMIATARARHLTGCHFEVGDACRLPADNACYQVVTCMTALEFVTDPAAALAGMVRCTEYGGVVIIGTLNRLSPVNRQRAATAGSPYAAARLLSPAELRALLEPHGHVTIVSADAGDGGTPGLMATAAEWFRLRTGRSAAPFLAALLRPHR